MSRNPRRSSRSSLPILVAVALAALAAPAVQGAQVLSEGVLVDAGVGYAMRPGGGIDAIELSTGALRWSSTAAAKPLHLTDDGLLVAQAEAQAPGALALVALDAAGSGAARMAMTVALADGVWSGVDDRPGRAFRCSASGSATDLTLAWRESRVVDRRFAVPAPAFDEASGPVVASAAPAATQAGAVRIDLAAARAVPLQAQAAAPAAVAQFGLYLPGVEGRQRLSADGAHVLVSARTGAPGEWRKYEWSIYTTAGEAVGSFAHYAASAPFVVRGTILVFEDRPHTVVRDGAPVSRPLALRGVDLAAGTEVWSREVRDIAYRGPFLP